MSKKQRALCSQDFGTVHAFHDHNHADKWEAAVCIKAYKLLQTLSKQRKW